MGFDLSTPNVWPRRHNGRFLLWFGSNAFSKHHPTSALLLSHLPKYFLQRRQRASAEHSPSNIIQVAVAPDKKLEHPIILHLLLVSYAICSRFLFFFSIQVELLPYPSSPCSNWSPPSPLFHLPHLGLISKIWDPCSASKYVSQTASHTSLRAGRNR